jgi:hypothetical protein
MLLRRSGSGGGGGWILAGFNHSREMTASTNLSKEKLELGTKMTGSLGLSKETAQKRRKHQRQAENSATAAVEQGRSCSMRRDLAGIQYHVGM